VPYNYLLTPSIRKKLPLKIEDSILIFDEAHNLERSCEEIMSFKLSSDKLVQCDRSLQKLEHMYREQGTMSNVSSNGNSDKAGDKLDGTELLRMFINTLAKVIE
jgi:Rad3-related DNA helicase